MNLEDIEHEVNAIIGDRSPNVDWPLWRSVSLFNVFDFQESRFFALSFDDHGAGLKADGNIVAISAEDGLAILRAYCEFLDARAKMQATLDALLNG